MEKHEDVTSILSKLDLDDIEETISKPYHSTEPGRPPRNPLGIFKALIVKRLCRIPSDRELYRRLWNDEALREICEIEEHEKPYHPSQLTRFRDRVSPERLEDIMNSLLEELSEVAIESGVKILSIKPITMPETAADKSGIYRQVPISIEAKCGYHDLGLFIQKLESLDRFMKISDIYLESNKSDAIRHNAKLEITTYTLIKEEK